MYSTADMSDHRIALDRFERIVEEDLILFRRNYGKDSIEEEQDLRALLISWVAFFLPEAIPKRLSIEIEATVREFRSRKDFPHYGWYALLPFDIALFAITGQNQWLDIHLANLDHHKQPLRTFLLNSLALVAPRLNFGDREILKRTQNNFKAVHFHCEWCAILLAISLGDPNKKRETFKRWAASFRLNEFERVTLERLAEGIPVETPSWSISSGSISM